MRICHATDSKTNPYISNEPAIANNGDLQGGHLNHTGPVFPANDWGDIIPPYTYTDVNGDEKGVPGEELGRSRAGDLAARLPSWAWIRCDRSPNASRSGRTVGSWRTSATTTRTSRPSRVRPRTSSSRSLRTGSSRPRSCPARMRMCSRSALQGGGLTWRLTGNQATATRRLAALPGLDHDRQGAQPEQRRRPVHARARR